VNRLLVSMSDRDETKAIELWPCGYDACCSGPCELILVTSASQASPRNDVTNSPRRSICLAVPAVKQLSFFIDTVCVL
jgi:hypothetical protein